MTVELIAIPNGLAGCKRKIEFDRCRWERRGGRKDERGERLAAQVWHGRWLIGIRTPFVGGKENECRGKTRFSPEGRKEGKRKNYLARQEIESTRQKPWDISDRMRLRAFGDNYRHVDSISIDYHALRASQALSIKASL